MPNRSPSPSVGLSAAYGPRRIREIKARHAADRALRFLGTRPSGGRPDFVEFTPGARNVREFSDLSARVNCYLGDVGLPLYLASQRMPLDAGTVPYLEPSLVQDPGWVNVRPPGRSLLLVHRLTLGTVAKIAAHGGAGATVVDKDLYYTSELAYWRVRERLVWPNYPSADVSLQRLRDHTSGSSTSFVLATGPSALSVDLDSVDADVRITCNSAVHDTDRLIAFRPTILAFTDPVFHFGPSRYAAAFREDLLRAVELCDPLLLCNNHWVSPLLRLLPELADRLVVLPVDSGGPWRWPTTRDPTVRLTGSVLTNLMLPVAFALTDHVRVAGVDGRQPGENYFWKHGLQYSDELMKTVFDAHPAFFRDRDYEDHYALYCQELEEFLAIAEASGKVVEAAAPSWIPAFRRRGAAEPCPEPDSADKAG